MSRNALIESSLAGIPVRRGKVRDVYDFGDRLLIVATDRISAFDWVLPTGIPDKGRVLTQMSELWFARLSTPNHWISMNADEVPLPADADRGILAGRSMGWLPVGLALMASLTSGIGYLAQPAGAVKEPGTSPSKSTIWNESPWVIWSELPTDAL